MKRGTPSHPKVADLAERLKIKIPHAVGLLEMLWQQTARIAIQGDIGKWSDSRIAEAAGWDKDPKKLVRALIESRWLDEDPEHRLLIHDWEDHADQAVHKTIRNRGMKFLRPATRIREKAGKIPEKDGIFPAPRLETVEHDTQPIPAIHSHSHNRSQQPQPQPQPASVAVAEEIFEVGDPGPNKSRFLEFWRRYSVGRGTNENAAARAWVAFDCEAHADAVFDCFASYEKSRDWANGAVQNADKWLSINAVDNWRSRWPPASKKTDGWNRKQEAVNNRFDERLLGDMGRE